MAALPATCVSCTTSLKSGGLCGDKAFTCESPDCNNTLCKTCFGQRPLWVGQDLTNGAVQRLCPTCFQQRSTLSFDNTMYDSTASSTSSNTTFVFVHGASGCREMFRPHAVALHAQYGHGYILLDLPGHGTLVDTALTLESCVDTVQRVLSQCALPSTERLVYVGASLGAYVGFHVLQHLPNVFHGAVLLDCGQNVGPDRGMAARAGLVVLKAIAENSSNYSMMNMMMGASKKSKADYHLVDTVYGAGMWFDQAAAHVECLRSVSPAECLAHIQNCPILYLNGSEDHRDSEQRWLEASSQDKSLLHVYEGGDHFFTHDSRFVDDMLERMHTFQESL